MNNNNNNNESGDNFMTGTGFQVPSFGDEDFDLLQVPLIMPSEQQQHQQQHQQQQHQQQHQQQGHLGSDSHDMFNTQNQPMTHQQMQNNPVTMASNVPQHNSNIFTNIGNQTSNVAPKFPPQNFYDPDMNVTNPFQGTNPNFVGNTGNMFSNIAMTTSGAMYQGQTTQGHMVTAGQPSLSNQMGGFQGSPLNQGSHLSHGSPLQASQMTQGSPMNQGSPLPTNSVSPIRESTSEDSDDSLPLAQLVSLKRQAAVKNEVKTSPKPEITRPAASSKTVSPPPAKKTKTAKRRKNKDPNEPQKPVSAYALFFRDTQAAIKGQNPSASFGEVSKIVASMWDGLDPGHKNVYKKKTELAKKDYLKQLAAYRASQVSLAAVEEANAMDKSSPYQSPVHMPQVNPIMGDNSQMMAHPMEQASPPQVINYSPPHQQTVPQQYSANQHSNMAYTPQNQVNYVGGMMGMNMCKRNGCGNNAIINPCWDEEYCSSDCVVSHCRDVFTAWVANRQAIPS